MSLMFQPLKKYADFSGRARRSEFWLFGLFIFLVEIVYFVLMGVTGNLEPTGYTQMNGVGVALAGLFSLFCLGMLIPGLAVTFRRLHDTNRSAWWLLIGLLPVIGSLVLLVFYLLPGTTGPNRFGADPKGAGEAAASVFS
ncbi:hypothetical protein ASD38_11275 [Caulobacter sp. Root487D2Y]|uniref:DUF805 domain-containing protein n=1 Tax=Caulobacter sp. Root487D2Y TaxID=1736547 RepID=UPI0006F2BCEA|nr:DUF805 domain-containing protein [Caulobacter sp. Root487D2Y]KQY29890.1 hypothetical protein ASD38_11275 [Caulobacter sp. Root487D2Y]